MQLKAKDTVYDLVSIIIPLYNSELYIGDCLDSILAQTYREIEVILVDDGSTDQSAAICDLYASVDPRFKVIHQDNLGVSAARNTGIDHAAGRWITFVDSDDFLHPLMIEVLIGAAKKEDVPIAIGDFSLTSKDYPHYRFQDPQPVRIRRQTSSWYIEALLNNKVQKSVWGMLFQAELIKGVYFTKGRIYEDLPYLPLVMRDHPPLVKINHVLYLQRINPDSITHQAVNMSTADRIAMKALQVRRIERYFPELKSLAITAFYADCMIWQSRTWTARNKKAGAKLEKQILYCMKRIPLTFDTINNEKVPFGRKVSLIAAKIDFIFACRVKQYLVRWMNRS